MKMTLGAFKSSPIKSIYNIVGERTPILKIIQFDTSIRRETNQQIFK